MRSTSSPSESVKSFSLIKRTVENPTGPRYGRPSDRFGPPTALFSQELAILRYDLEHLEAFAPNSAGADYAFSLIERAAYFFDDGSIRESALRPILETLLPGNSQWQQQTPDGSAKSEGVWLQGHFAYLIVEVKNEPGLGGDPFLQGAVVYTKILAQDKVRPCSCPFNLHHTQMPQIVSSIPQSVEPTRRPARHSGELSRCVDRHLHRLRLCRQTGFD